MNEAALSGFFRSRRGGQPSADGPEDQMRSAHSPRRDCMPCRVRTPRRNRRGLIGILLSIVIVVAIIIAVFAIYNQVTAAANAAQTAVFVRQLAPQISARYGGNYTGLNNAAAISSGFVPDNWRNGDSIVDPDGTAVTIRSSGVDTSILVITFVGGVPVQTCKAVLGALKSDPTFDSARIAGTRHLRIAVDTAVEIDMHCARSQTADFQVRFK